MKKSLLSILALALVAVGCQNYDDQFDSLNADIAALASTVSGLDAGVAAQVTAVANSVAALATQVTALGANITTQSAAQTAATDALGTQLTADAAATAAALAAQTATQVAADAAQTAATDALGTELTAQTVAQTAAEVAQTAVLISELAGVLTNVAAVSADLAALDTSVATQIAGVNTNVASLTSQLTAVQTAALTAADVAALTEVTNLNAEVVQIIAALDELLAAQASVNGDVSITNQAELDYAETLIETDGTPANYIINGNLNIVTTTAASYDTGYIAAITLLTGKIASVLGTVTITTATTDAALDIAQLTYVSGALAITGKMPSGFAIGTAASLALDVEEADITLATLTSAAGGVTIDITGTVTITNVTIANLTNGSVTTDTAILNLVNADVNLGAGHPAVTTTAKSLIAGNATDILTGATLTITNALTLASKVVTGTIIDAGGAVTLSSGVAGSSFAASTINSGGDINVAALSLGAATTSATTLVCDGGSGSVTIGATSTAGALTATASGSTISAGSLANIGAGITTLSGTAVTLTGLASNTGGLTVALATSLNLPALASSTGKVTATAATSFSAPLLTTAATVNIAGASTFAVKALGAIGHWVDIATGTAFTVTEQDVTLDLSAAVHMVSLTYTGKAIAAGGNAAEATDLTYSVLTAASSLTTVVLDGGMNNVTIKAPLMTSLSTGGFIRTFTTTGTTLTSITVGHQGLNGGVPSELSIADTKITSLDLSNLKWIGGITVTGNTSMTALTMPTATAAADNANVATTGRVTVTINNNALTGAWTRSVTATGANLYVEGFWSTAPGITGAKTWLTALVSNVIIATSSVTYAIEVDAADAALTANSDSDIIDGTSAIDIAGELALLPN